MKKNVIGFFLLVICTNMSLSVYTQATNVQDSLALVALYNSTDGAHWRLNENWINGPVATWYGITVTDERVTGVNLRSNKLTGNIPPELGKLAKLSVMDLSLNEINSSIPPELGKLSNLAVLNLYYNDLSGSIPPELGNLSLLDSLDLSFNNLNDSIPPGLGNLSNLTVMDLYANNLTGSIPPELGNLSSLLYLRLHYNQLSGSIPPELEKLSSLLDLRLEHNQLTGIIPPELGNLAKVTDIDLDQNQLNGGVPPELGKPTSLQYLILSDNLLTGGIPPELGNLSSLWALNLGNNLLSGNIPPELGNLSNLTVMGLDNNQLSGSIPAELGSLSNLTVMGLDNNQLSGSIPPDLSDLEGFIDLSYNRFTFDGMELFVQSITYPFYSPQANIPIHFLNDSSLFISAGGTLNNNTYKWFIVGQSDSVMISGDSVFRPWQTGKYYAAVTNSVCTALTLHTDTINFTATMPVTIINLRAQPTDKFVKVSWTSVTETNVARYETQRSANAISFSTIGSVIAKGNGTAHYDYDFNDLQPQHGNNYYRLKIIDQDGKTNYSIIVSVNIDQNKTVTVVYPVPAKDILHIQTSDNTSFCLLDQSGKILLTTNINGSGTMNVSSMTAGLYYLKNNTNGEVTKIVIAR